jgi:hypothetical protein
MIRSNDLPLGRTLFVLAVFLELVAMLIVGSFARGGALPSRVVVTLLAAFVPYLAALFLSKSREPTTPMAVAATAALGAVLVFAPPVLSDDLYRYLWEGRVWLLGENPYRIPPSDPSLAAFRDALWEPINNKALASIYPPFLQVVFVMSALLGGHVWTIKLLALLGLLLSVFVIARVSKRPRLALALGLNPLALSETALNGHFDFLVGGLLLLAAASLGRHALRLAGIATSVAVGLKVVGLVLAPLFWRRPRALLATSCVSALLLFPLVLSRAPGDPTSGPGQFAVRWQGNDSVFALVDWTVRQLTEPETAALVARLVVGLAMFAVAAIVLRANRPPLESARTLIWAVLLLSPQVHPWYLGWLLPLELACGGRAGLGWSALVLAAYAPLDRWITDGVWAMPVWLQLAEYLLLGVAVLLDPRRPRLAATVQDRDSPLIAVR